MLTRATYAGISSRLAKYASLHGSNLLRLQDQISSGIRITRSSEDPLAFRQITSFQSQLKHLEDSAFVITDAESKLNASVSQLTEFHRLVAEAKRIAQEGIQSLSAGDRQALALEAEGILRQMQEIANTNFAGQYLYGGARSSSQPYQFGPAALPGRTLTANYSGVAESGESVISPSLSVETLYSGSRIFDSAERGPTVLYGITGAQTGPGTDSLTGRATLQVRHTNTTYLGGSGIQAGSSSAAGDTVLGTAGRHVVTLVDTSGTGAAGTISLNGGPTLAWTSSDTNLMVSGQSGEKIYVDTSAIAAGFNGTVDLQSDGTLSVDNGATTLNIDFSANQGVTDSLTGRSVTINSSGISLTGDDYLEFSGTSNAFQVVDELIQDLRGTRSLQNSQFADAINRRIGELEHMGDQTLSIVGLQATSLEGLDQLKLRNEDMQYETKQRLGDLQSTDLAAAVVQLANEQSLQQYTFLVASRILSQSLVNFLS